MFIDEAKIRVKAGDGGNGCMAFRREKFVPRGGPSGGDGGHGGNVVMESTQRHNTLVYFRFNPEHKGERGEHGMGSNCTGRDGEDTILKVPVGSVLFVGCAVGKVKLEDVMRGIWPFYGVLFAVLMLVTFIPALSLWLPSVVIK